MKKLLVGLLVLLIIIQVSPVYGRDSMVDKYKMYQTQSKNPWVAIGLSSIFPSLGHLYAGNWGKGLLFLLADVGGVMLYSGAGSTNLSFNAGIIMLSASKIWEVMDVYHLVNQHNQKLKGELAINSISSNASSPDDLSIILNQYVNESQRYTNGIGIGNTWIGTISKDGLGYPRNIYGLNTLIGYSHTLVFGGQPSIDEVVAAYNQVKRSSSEEEIKEKGMRNLLRAKLNKSSFWYFEYGNSYLILPINYYWGQIITVSDVARVKWGLGTPTLLSLGFSYDF